MLDQGEHGKEKYQNILRRTFRHTSYYKRREMVLGTEVMGEISENELVERIRNSLVFVFNSTVKNRDDENRPVFYEDIKILDTETTEKKVLRTLLEMEYQIPHNIKYDFHYNWLVSLNKELQRYDEFMKTSKNGRGFRWKVPMEYIGFKQYQTTLMRFNETHKLCL